ncbi:MAG TPA: SUMF1/EgtB/PvdO family nonheme iron enzyme [Kiritimatiellia bacterium]|nr:SUMF1/EgtB/PvdO family nonheme iron enzyme [Kiritimatiellia bacterium]HPS06441.1 SUMF1/EgtB/PvdO family nonheme iron enzyme [Kiritimatiellia bacterium]
MKFVLLVLSAALAFCATAQEHADLRRQLALLQPEAVRLALDDMAARWPHACGATDRSWCATLGERRDALLKRLDGGDIPAETEARSLLMQVRAALLDNPLLDMDKLLVVRRGGNNLALPQNWQQQRDVNRKGLTNEIAVMTGLRGKPMLKPLHIAAPGTYVGDLQLHWDARRLMFTGENDKHLHRVFELDLNAPERVTAFPFIPDDDVDNYAGCWLADDSVIFLSNATFIGVPCVVGSSYVAALYRWYPSDGRIRRLTFDQDHNWYPSQMQDGRIMYLRWEYSGIVHYVSRLLFAMNPDGTGQRELYGSNCYWPNAMFYARPVPDSPHRFTAVVSGHHGVPRMGELVLFDPSLGRKETQGVVQRIPGRGEKVMPIVKDNLVDDSWPKFLHPWPLVGGYVLTACKPAPDALWGLYLADTFDNLTLIYEEPGQAIFEPVPVQPKPRPVLLQDHVKEGETKGRVKITDIYQGPGLAGVPRGAVKRLRLLTYSFAYRGMGSETDRVGFDGPWDVVRIMGTVPVEADGSAYFEIPANTPVSLQPLDAQGRALQLMRSWLTVMPGELQSCSGCHEPQNSGAGPLARVRAMEREPSTVTPWYGPERGISFNREVQPVLDRYCIRCHNGTTGRPDFRLLPGVSIKTKEVYYINANNLFPPAYLALCAHIRSQTQEGDNNLQPPCNFHVSTTELFQILEAGHHGVRLDAESWDRLTTWIDMNRPNHGNWSENVGGARMGNLAARRREMQQRYAKLNEDHEATYGMAGLAAPALPPAEEQAKAKPEPSVAGWPFDATSARAKQHALGDVQRTLDLGGLTLTLVRIPAGTFATADGRTVEIKKPFWMSADEITNEQYARFDPSHDSFMERGEYMQFTPEERGYPLNTPTQPVCRVAFESAQAFCRFAEKAAGARVRLPSGDEWEWAARAGVATPLAYGDIATDFSTFANLADAVFRKMERLRANMPGAAIPAWRPAVTNCSDGFRVSSPVGTFAPNAWGLHDVHGNVWEWTSDRLPDGRVTARGGSWWKRPQYATFAARVPYEPWQKVYDVGFRVLVED